ncbi:MAG TPA: imidazoleglycerol-phosphate dehydratase HisB [Feifaniaceae bacterium]|nr:imidazoleglycerol-phosphate dehydratase HisB [Feifaniaceae bacterium]
MRVGNITRKTAETDISLALNLDGAGKSAVSTGVGFLDHMLTLFARHGNFDLDVTCKGDLAVDGHHSVEDTGICLGQAFRDALGEKRGIARYGSFLLPMDEALVLVALDISGRAHLSYGLMIPAQKVGTFDTELAEEFLLGFCRSMGLTLHVKQLAGTNSHHILEAAFKGLGRALSQAVAIDTAHADEIPSTKGMLE